MTKEQYQKIQLEGANRRAFQRIYGYPFERNCPYPKNSEEYEAWIIGYDTEKLMKG